MTSNGNITLPAGASNHGDPNILCLPAKWTDIVIFFLGNYFAHAATIRSSPGYSIYPSAMNAVTALFFPASGIRRGLEGVFSLAKFGRTDLQMAARAGALCRVVRKDKEDYKRRFKFNSEGPTNSWMSVKIHGRIRLPEGYKLAIVHRKAKFMQDDDPSSRINLSSNFNVISVLIAFGQLAFAVTTLYRSRGDQIARYGYAAFGLTVTQYAFMSIINLVGNLICPQYPALYLVESEEMREARALPGALFEGCVGKLEPHQDKRREDDSIQRMLRYWPLPLVLIPTSLSVSIIAALSHFDKGSSTLAQRTWTMSWLAVGSWIGVFRPGYVGDDFPWIQENRTLIFFDWFFQIIYSVPAIGGFVVVGQMLREYGVCTRT